MWVPCSTKALSPGLVICLSGGRRSKKGAPFRLAPNPCRGFYSPSLPSTLRILILACGAAKTLGYDPSVLFFLDLLFLHLGHFTHITSGVFPLAGGVTLEARLDKQKGIFLI